MNNDISYITATTKPEYESEFGLQNTHHSSTSGELWSVFCENFGENWLRYNGTPLCICIYESYVVQDSHFILYISLFLLQFKGFVIWLSRITYNRYKLSITLIVWDRETL